MTAMAAGGRPEERAKMVGRSANAAPVDAAMKWGQEGIDASTPLAGEATANDRKQYRDDKSPPQPELESANPDFADDLIALRHPDIVGNSATSFGRTGA
jgi:hypothetical protein